MSILTRVRKERLRYEEERGQSPTGIMLHPLDLARAELEAWSRAEAGGHYGMPRKLTRLAGLVIVEDPGTPEGEMRAVRPRDIEELVGRRLDAWRKKNGVRK